MTERVHVEQQDGVAQVRLDRPEKKNALDAGMFDGLLSVARSLRHERSLRAVVLSGAGDSFSSSLGDMVSGDLDPESESIQAATRDLSRDGANRAQQLAWLWQELPVPVIAAVQGVAFGGGLHIALGADIRIVAPDARIAFVEITWGLVPDLSGTQALRRLVPLDVAKKLIFTGEVISGERAVALGLGTELSDHPVEAATELARVIAGRSPDAVRAAKQLLNQSGLVPLAEGLANEMAASSGLMGRPNQIEAVMAKLQKRSPQFQDPETAVGPIEGETR
ncbi:MAG: enoyl-CoA hydratase [Deltaproteobacteria bacterium]|jgi:enoyl-CoA hydratase/carnithine racemase|nr:enoyl-CoA hydratase [Deltaproteobacteria bacterium]